MTEESKGPAEYERETVIEPPKGDAAEPAAKSEEKAIVTPIDEAWKTLEEAQVNLSKAPPRRKWLLKIDNAGALPLGKAGALVAGGGTGKTMLLLQLAIAVALRKRGDTPAQWVGRFDVATEDVDGDVMIALAEEDLGEVQRRFFSAARALDLDNAEIATVARRIVALPLAGTPVALTSRDQKGGIHNSATLDALQRRLAQGRWSLVILDPLSRWAGEDAEVDNAAATRFVQAVETLLRAPGEPTVLVAHHSSKQGAMAGNADARGVSGLTDGFRWVASLDRATAVINESRTIHGVRMRLKKTNYTKPWPEDVYLTWHSEDENDSATLRLAEPYQKIALQGALKDTASTTTQQKSEQPPKEQDKKDGKGNRAHSPPDPLMRGIGR